MALSDSVSPCPDCVQYLLPANPFAQAGYIEKGAASLAELGSNGKHVPLAQPNENFFGLGLLEDSRELLSRFRVCV